MSEDGELVGQGGFRVDRRKALETLRRSQLPDGFWPPLLWLRLAAVCGTNRLRITRGSHSLTLTLDRLPLPATLLSEPLGRLAAGDASPVEAWLGWAVLHSLGPGADVAVTTGLGSQRRTWRYRPDGAATPVEPAAGADAVVELGWKPRRAAVMEVEPPPEALDALPYTLDTASGTAPPWERRKAPEAMTWQDGGRRLHAAYGERPAQRLAHWGVFVHSVAIPDFLLPVEVTVDDPALTLNASLAAPVADGAFQRAIAAGRRAAERFSLRHLARHGAAMRLAGPLLYRRPDLQRVWSATMALGRRGGTRLPVAARLAKLTGAVSGDALRVARAALECARLRAAAHGELWGLRIDGRDAVRSALWRAPLLFAYGGKPVSLADLADADDPSAPRPWLIASADGAFLRDFPNRPHRLE